MELYVRKHGSLGQEELSWHCAGITMDVSRLVFYRWDLGRGSQVKMTEQILLHEICRHKPHVGGTNTTYRLIPRTLHG
jgi:hypothetical protein